LSIAKLQAAMASACNEKERHTKRSAKPEVMSQRDLTIDDDLMMTAHLVSAHAGQTDAQQEGKKK